jgi:hypothetical protein
MDILGLLRCSLPISEATPGPVTHTPNQVFVHVLRGARDDVKIGTSARLVLKTEVNFPETGVVNRSELRGSTM